MAPAVVSTSHLAFPPIGGSEKYLFKGRYLGRELKDIFEDSTGLFPRSAKHKPSYYESDGRPVRYTSEYVRNFEVLSGRPRSYGNDDGYNKYGDRPDVIGARRPWTEPIKLPSASSKELTAFQRGTYARKGHIHHPSQWQMFSSWKVPTRVLDNSPRLSPRREKQAHSQPASSDSKREKTPRQKTPPKSPRKETPPGEKPSSPRKLGSQRKTCQEEDAIVKKARSEQFLERSQQLLKNADSNQRRVIEKTYKEAQRGEFEHEFMQKKNKVKDSKSILNRWLDSATDEERKAAIEFFSVLQKKNREQGNPDGSVKVDEVLKMLDSVRISKSKTSKSFPQLDGQTKTKYLRLNSPGTRKNQWMYQTWHHMPPITDKNVTECKSSHYVDAQAPQHRHFTIHPDWGP